MSTNLALQCIERQVQALSILPEIVNILDIFSAL
jgi:hypothetical protein